MSAQLTITAGPDEGRSFPLQHGATFQVGRSQATPTRLTDASVSRVHFEVQYDGADAVLVNLSSGGTLVNGQRVDRHPLRPGDGAAHIARALEYAHGQSVIHRNVTPQNILLRSADKAAKLGDLMLAKALEGALAQQHTTPGELVGDVGYMASERTRGAGEVDGRSDLYGLGATVYALVTGRPPFAGGSLPEMVGKIRNAEPEKPKKFQMAIPDLFQGTVLKLLAKRPEERFQSAGELLKDLERVGKFAGVSV